MRYGQIGEYKIIIMKKTAWALYLLALSFPCSADQLLLANAQEAEQVFWKELYPDTHYTLYCGERFSNKHEDLTIDLVYPVQWIISHLGCESAEQCRNESRRFNRIEADLHNYYPALKMIARARSNYVFGEVPGEFREFFECDFEQDVRNEVVEARNMALGNIARSLFYMHWEYGLPIKNHSLDTLINWHYQDPPSKDEKRRNEIIHKLQGTRNIFIDNPAKAEQLRSERPSGI